MEQYQSGGVQQNMGGQFVQPNFQPYSQNMQNNYPQQPQGYPQPQMYSGQMQQSGMNPQFIQPNMQQPYLQNIQQPYSQNIQQPLYFDYRFSDHFALSPNIDYVFRHNGTDAFIFNLDARFPFRVAPRFDVYPLIGVDYASWAYHSHNDSSDRLNHLGFNFGAGCDYFCTPSLKLTFQGKYNAIKDVDSAYFWLGIGYVF